MCIFLCVWLLVSCLASWLSDWLNVTIHRYLGSTLLADSEKYTFYRAIQPSNPNIHFVRLTINVRGRNKEVGWEHLGKVKVEKMYKYSFIDSSRNLHLQMGATISWRLSTGQRESSAAQCSVLTAQFSVLSAQWSVFSAQCSVLIAHCSVLSSKC